MRLHLFSLLYGDFPVLHARLLDSFVRFVPEEVSVRLWLNCVSSRSQKIVDDRREQRKWRVTSSEENRPKYVVMREMFQEVKAQAEDEDWVIWFDDDSHIIEQGWIDQVIGRLLSQPQTRYIGQPWFVHHLPGQWSFIQQAAWFKGQPPQMIKNKPGIWFAQGAYWWLRVDALRALDWPDPRLRHNGGDTLLGEAVRQQGWHFMKLPKDSQHVSCGVKVNDAKRRGHSEAPAGCTRAHHRR